MKGFVTVRYTGQDATRRFLVQKRDGQFWTGRRWADRLDAARLYHCLRDAQLACLSIQRRRWRGKRVRKYRCELTVTVAGNEPVTADAVREYLLRALNLNIDVVAHGDGPGQSVVVVAALLGMLAEADDDG